MKIIDNDIETLKDSLILTIQNGSKICVAASCFSMYAFKELYEQLKDIEEFRFIFTSPTFIKNERESNASSNSVGNFENNLYGTEFETKLRNILSQKAVAQEFAEWIKQDNIHLRANKSGNKIGGFAVIQPPDKKQTTAYAPLQDFTTISLGTSEKKDNYNFIHELEMPFSKQYLTLFNDIWHDKKSLTDIKENIIERIEVMFAENSPEFIYYTALCYIFSDYLKDTLNEDFYANERVGYKNSVIWNTLFDFQKDAVLNIISKLEKFNGCILADSVGLGKTYTALAIIKYYEARNKNVLVLCPKKLSDNWNTFNNSYINNPFSADKFRYDVFYHTDLSRLETDAYSNNKKLNMINWGSYDLVVIDESHNFRNSGKTYDGKINRYQTLLEKIIQTGVNTKVLMLSATPVNNRFNDLRNQLQLAYQNGDSKIFEEKLGIENTVEGIFKKAQAVFNRWSRLEPKYRTAANLIKELDFDFFELLESVTIARSRKQIQSHYDLNSIGSFPQRLSPLSYSPEMTDLIDVPAYDEIFDALLNLSLSVYTPSGYIKEEKRSVYAQEFGETFDSLGNRESGIKRLMAINLMKRLESSVYSFMLTLERIGGKISDTIEKIDEYSQTQEGSIENTFDYDVYDEDMSDEMFFVGNKIKINFCDMETELWKRALMKDKLIIDELYEKIKVINPAHDLKLKKLFTVIDNKIKNPINDGNKKILIFTAFADTAEYLFKNVSRHAYKLGLNTAMVSGKNDGISTIDGLPNDLTTILTCFSPISKKRALMRLNQAAANVDIDILIGTDCISEGQNLQDCDCCINYDIHWNPVRIIQRYGRIDRIGSRNKYIRLINFWPDVSLDEYINLKQTVETKMNIVGLTSTPEEKVLSDEEKSDWEYRKTQLEKIKSEVVDIEDMSMGVSLPELVMNEFKLDLLDYVKNNNITNKPKKGLYAVTKSDASYPPGVILVLKNVSMKSNIKNQNRLHPFYLMYIEDSGKTYLNYLKPKDILTKFRQLCKGNDKPNEKLCRIFNDETRYGKNMDKYTKILTAAVKSIVETKKETDINSLFRAKGTSLTSKEKITNLDDFELICFLVIK